METTLAERVIHLALFVVAAGGAGVVALFVLDRTLGDTKPVIRIVHVLTAIALGIGLFVVERVYHLVN